MIKGCAAATALITAVTTTITSPTSSAIFIITAVPTLQTVCTALKPIFQERIPMKRPV